MKEKLQRVGTTYIPVTDINRSKDWYVNKLGAELSYLDEDKAILNLADQSVFLVRSHQGQTSNFEDFNGEERFSLTFEVNGLEALETMHREFIEQEINVGKIENRGHAGRNFVFQDPNGNLFDVWSELSPKYKKLHMITP
ncbi:VOC family protein [Fictibacillus sp. BK138]|uniref:VOC family protein n=1 Tax=Fictibacillus sp. BK138 TaxID=2512121 RepID=UPI001029A9D8|nr:VOC family protein [Fictibacillus sp. BK138]RZT23668.1 catechol 2,3-dioxygenase-like lactoylglutathione lyase family enzyme [Fictibacillus sp. BK138]